MYREWWVCLPDDCSHPPLLPPKPKKSKCMSSSYSLLSLSFLSLFTLIPTLLSLLPSLPPHSFLHLSLPPLPSTFPPYLTSSTHPPSLLPFLFLLLHHFIVSPLWSFLLLAPILFPLLNLNHLTSSPPFFPSLKVLVVGGDGGVLREVAEHKTVEEIHSCEIDEV